MLSMALHLRGQDLSLRDIASQLVITKGTKERPAPLPGDRPAHAARTRRTDDDLSVTPFTLVR
jgi:hypothetical protein